MVTVTFNNNKRDKKLIEDIEKYQKEKELSSRVEAVRQLCETALKVETLTKNI